MHEGDEVRADIGDLTQSALQVARCGEDMAAAHTAADVRVDSALAGWQGLSAAALTVRSETWLANTTALLTELGTHVEALHRCAQTFSEMERDHAAAIEAVHPRGGTSAPAPTGGVDARNM